MFHDSFDLGFSLYGLSTSNGVWSECHISLLRKILSWFKQEMKFGTGHTVFRVLYSYQRFVSFSNRYPSLIIRVQPYS